MKVASKEERREVIAAAANRLRSRQARMEDGGCTALLYASGPCASCHATADGLHAVEESADSPTKLYCKLCCPWCAGRVRTPRAEAATPLPA